MNAIRVLATEETIGPTPERMQVRLGSLPSTYEGKYGLNKPLRPSPLTHLIPDCRGLLPFVPMPGAKKV